MAALHRFQTRQKSDISGAYLQARDIEREHLCEASDLLDDILGRAMETPKTSVRFSLLRETVADGC